MAYDVTVACVLRSGGVYTADWVAKLQRGVSRHLTVPHRFVCLSDVAVPCERIYLMTDWPRWWAKMELFAPGLFDGPVLYFDLDTVIVGSLDKIATHPHTFTMAHEFYRPQQHCSTAMAWQGEFGLFETFRDDREAIMDRYSRSFAKIGDQAFIEDHLAARGVKVETFRDLFGERSVASYKVHKCADGPPHDAAVVAFHGKPKPNQITHGWVRHAWH